MKKLSKFQNSDYIYMLSGIVFFTGVLLLGWFGWQKFVGGRQATVVDAAPGVTQNEPVCENRRNLDGVCLKKNEKDPDRLVAVMIENHTDARPPSGLARAAIVYEAPVEANITRFLAIYDSAADAPEVGPIRSVRPYYLDWAHEYHTPLFVHVGGSPEALEKLQMLDSRELIFDMDEFYRGWYFWRSDNRIAPHNTYTSGDLWRKAVKDHEDAYVDGGFEAWKFSSEPRGECEESCASGIIVSFAPPAYQPVWTYNTSTKNYDRYQSGRPHADSDGTSITADTVIVQRVKVRVLDDVGRRAIATVGSGEATVFVYGHAIQGTWKKDSVEGRTRWFDVEGKEIELSPGKIWIEIVSREMRITTE